MATITEDYVSFEVAKLLKEKGFDEPCYQYYLTTKTLHTTFHNRVHVEEEPFFNSSELNGLYEVSDKTLFEDICSAPTHQMAMKWLREEHDIFVYVHIFIQAEKSYWVQFVKESEGRDLGYIEEQTHSCTVPVNYKSYEDAAEAGIRYCLENLI